MLTFLLLTVIAQAPLPELKLEATDGGSALVVRNAHPSQALTAYLIELVDYPGSSWAFSQDELASGTEPLGAGKQRRIPISNMTVGAAPDYIKVRAALFADGSAAGSDDKVSQLRARRDILQSMIGEILARPNQLKVSHVVVPPSKSKLNRADPDVVTRGAMQALLAEAIELQAAGTLAQKFQARAEALVK